jgi:integrase
MARSRGDGLYQRPDSEVFWVSYIDSNGKRRRESTKTTDRDTAKRILDDRRGRVARGEVLLPRVDRVAYDEARADLLTYYETHGTRNLAEAKVRLGHLDAFFTGRKLVSIGQAEATAYAKARQDEGAAAGTINRELATLSKLLHLAYEHGKLQRVPVVKKLREADPRAGFVTREQFAGISKHLPVELQAPSLVAFTLGWRKREVLNLQRRQLDLQAGTLRLDPGKTKNWEGRVAHLTPELKAALVAQVERVKELERKAGRIVAWLFPHLEGPHTGERILTPRKAWSTACKQAGLPGLLFHDLRRSAVRNMEQAGVPRSVAMKISGHKTEAVYRRYAIVSDADLAAAAQKLAAAR